jgi:hypothetical protein
MASDPSFLHRAASSSRIIMGRVALHWRSSAYAAARTSANSDGFMTPAAQGKNRKAVSPARLTVMLSASLRMEGKNRHGGNRRGQVAHPPGTRGSLWVAGQDASRVGVERNGPRYAKFGRHVRYRLSDVIDWESKRFA